MGNIRDVDAVDVMKAALNKCDATSKYTKIVNLRDNIGYRVDNFERVTTPYGETVMVTLSGLTDLGDDTQLRVYLPRRYNDIIIDDFITMYNKGTSTPMRMIKKPSHNGSKFTPLEFV